jgi:hypothetical protein
VNVSQFSDYLENALLNHLLRATALPSPATVYLALYTSNPTDADSGAEVAGGSYARQPISFAAPAGGIALNSAQVAFPVATADWGTITHFGIRDAAAAGNLLFHAPMTEARTINEDDQLVFDPGQVAVALQ